MYWILYSEVFKSFYDFNKSGSTIQHLYQNVFNEFKYPLPPIKEQIEIVNHVNKKTDELDLVISKTKQEIALLKEYKTALISEVVTGKVDVSTSSTQVLGTKN
jgi:type I restriction enzyme S subunit